MTDSKQYPPLPDFEEVEQHIYLVSRGYIPQGMLEPIHDLMRAYVDADRAMRAAQAAPQPVEHPWVASDTMRADLIADLREVFGTSESETPQIVRDVIEYANSWLQVCIQKKAESSAQQAAPASQDAEDAARYRGLRDLAKEQLLYPQRAASSLAADMRTHWELPVLICSGPIGGYRDFDSAVDSAIDAARAKQEGE